MTSSSRARKLREEAKKKDAIIAGLAEENARLRAIRQAGMRRVPDGEQTDKIHAYRWHAKEIIRHTLTDPDTIYKKTHVPMDIFRFVVPLCKDVIASSDHPPFCGSDAGPDPKKCSIEKAMLLYLEYQNTKETVEGLGVDFAMDPEAVSRYVKFIGGVLEEVLPTPRNLFGLLGTARTAEELEEFIPGLETGIYYNRIPTNLPSDWEPDTYHIAKKGPTTGTVLITAGKAVCIAQGETRPEAEHDPDEIIGEVGRAAARVGVQIMMEGGKIFTDTKRPGPREHPNIKFVTQGGKSRNDEEHHIRKMRAHMRTSGTFTGTLEELSHILQVVSGTVNLMSLGPEKWMQLHKKYGPRVVH